MRRSKDVSGYDYDLGKRWKFANWAMACMCRGVGSMLDINCVVTLVGF